MKKVYVAGPDVFLQDVQTWAATARSLCAQRGLQALLPLDGVETTAQGIYAANCQLLAAADAVVANLNPFRGSHEPDSGTCVEIGMALALGKPVVGYMQDTRPLIARVATSWVDGKGLDDQGMVVEGFGLPVNLMIGVPVTIVKGSLENALDALVDRFVAAGSIETQHA